MPHREETISVGLSVGEAWRLWTHNAKALVGDPASEFDFVHDSQGRTSSWRRSGVEAGSASFKDRGEGKSEVELRVSESEGQGADIKQRFADLAKGSSLDPAVTRADPDGTKAGADTDADQPL